MTTSYRTAAIAGLITVFVFAKATAEPRHDHDRHHDRRGAECGEITLGDDGLNYERHGRCRGHGHQGDDDDENGSRWGADAILFEHADFRGAALPLRGSIHDLAAMGFDDRASSIRVRRGVWQGCTEPRFRGRCWTVSDDDRRFAEPANNAIRSVRRIR